MNPVVRDHGSADTPEFAAARAAAAALAGFPVVGVVARDFVVIEHEAGRTGWRVGVEAVLLVVRQAVIGQRVVAAEHDASAGVVPDRRVVDRPARSRVDVHDPLVEVAAPRAEMLDRQIADRDVARRVSERIVVVVLAVDHRSWRANESCSRAGPDLRVPTGSEGVHAGSEPVRGVGSAPVDVRVVARADADRTCWGRGRAAP